MRPTSVLFGVDSEALDLLIPLHAVPDPVIADVTHNAGVMWKKATHSPTHRFDINPLTSDTIAADCRCLPLEMASVDVVVFDPPHLPAAIATPGSSGIERRQYGLTAEGEYRQGNTISGLFPEFLAEAWRVLRPNGIVLAKLSDYVHNHAYRWSHVDYVLALQDAGFTACDLLIKCDPTASNLKSSKWVNVRHLRRAHCFWIVGRKGKCESPHQAKGATSG